MKTNLIKTKLAEGESVLGTWCLMAAPMMTEILALAGLDFQIFDMEHGAYDVSALEEAVRVCELAGCSPLVRVPENRPSLVQVCLDLGAHGIVFPQIKDHASALAAVQSMSFAPDGVRGFNPFTRAGNYSGELGKDTPKLRNGYALCAVIIENLSAFKDLDRILTIPRLDVVYLGAYDMSVALGHPGETAHPAVVEFLETSIARIKAAGKVAGVMARSKGEFQKFLGLGARFIVAGVEAHLISRAIKDTRAAFEEARESRRDTP